MTVITIQPNLNEFEIKTVHFENEADCLAAGRKWTRELTDAAYAQKPEWSLRMGQPPTAPADAKISIRCGEHP